MPLESLLGALWRLPTVGQAIVGIWVKFASAPTPYRLFTDCGRGFCTLPAQLLRDPDLKNPASLSCQPTTVWSLPTGLPGRSQAGMQLLLRANAHGARVLGHSLLPDQVLPRSRNQAPPPLGCACTTARTAAGVLSLTWHR